MLKKFQCYFLNTFHIKVDFSSLFAQLRIAGFRKSIKTLSIVRILQKNKLLWHKRGKLYISIINDFAIKSLPICSLCCKIYRSFLKMKRLIEIPLRRACSVLWIKISRIHKKGNFWISQHYFELIISVTCWKNKSVM